MPDAQATSYSASMGGVVPLAVYRAVQDEKIALGETVRELQEKVLHHGATNKQTIAMLRKALQARLQATLAELAGGVEEIENKLRGPGATGGGHVSQKIQDAIAVQVGEGARKRFSKCSWRHCAASHLRSDVRSTQRRARSWAPTGLRTRQTASQPCPQPRCRCG